VSELDPGFWCHQSKYAVLWKGLLVQAWFMTALAG
jgi:hypothetical protein